MSEWQPIETAPKDGRVVLFHYLNRLGKSRIVRGFYAPKFCIEQDVEYGEFIDYDEITDRYFLPEGWYESIENWDEYSSVSLEAEYEPTHWMPLPDPPQLDEAD